MSMQISKHNKRYIEGMALMRSIFGEKRSGLVIAKFIENLVPTAEDLEPYESKVHRTAINLGDWYTFLKTNVDATQLATMKKTDAYKFHEDDIKLIISGVDLWNDATPASKLMKDMVLSKYSAHPSTQHNNERLVKIGSRMARTGKKAQLANYYLVASNGFIKEYHNDQPREELDDDSPSVLRKRGNSRGTKKLVDLETILFDLEKAYGRIANDKGPAVLKDEVEFVKMKLEGSDVIKKEKDEASVETMIDSFGTEKTNARITKFRGGFVLPLFNGYVQYTKLCNKKNLNAGGIVQKEFEARGLLPKFLSIIASKMRLGTQCTEALRTHETQRFNTELNGDLTELGIDFNESMPVTTKVNILKVTLKSRENVEGRDLSVYDIERKKYLKKESKEYSALSLLM